MMVIAQFKCPIVYLSEDELGGGSPVTTLRPASNLPSYQGNKHYSTQVVTLQQDTVLFCVACD
jgi:hypothetical protein